MTLEPNDIVSIATAMGVLFTAVAAVIGALSSLRNGKVADKVKLDTDLMKEDIANNTRTTNETRDKVTRITMDVDGRFSATQAQLSRVIEHVISINPEIIAKAALAAKGVLETAERTRQDLKVFTHEQPTEVSIVPGEEPLPVEVVPPVKRSNEKG